MRIDELKALRARAAKQFHDDADTTRSDAWRIVVSMDTTAILHGARDILATFLAEVAALKLENVQVSHSGSFGLHTIEPACWICRHGGPKVLYGGLRPGMIRALLVSHIVNDTVLQAYQVVVPRVRAHEVPHAHLAHHRHARHGAQKKAAMLPAAANLDSVFLKTA